MEITSWIWMFLLDWAVGLISILALALLNVKGDKKPADEGVLGLAVPGKVRFIVEILTASIGVIYSLILVPLFGILPFLFQIGIVIVYIRADKERLNWLVGRRTETPIYIKKLHQVKKSK